MSVKDSSLFSLEGKTVKEKEKILGIVFIIPSLILVGLIIVYPLFYNAYLGFTNVPLNPNQAVEWVGFAHYNTLFSDPEFWDVIATTLVFTIFSDIGATTGGVIVALLLKRSIFGQRLIQVLVLLPWIAPLIATALVWQYMLQPQFGLVPLLFESLNIVNDFPDVLGRSESALWGVIVYDTWRFYPFAYLMIIARVQSIPDELYEAARIDGAGWIAQFKDITLPELKYVVGTVFLLRGIWNLQKFADIWLLTREVDTLSVYAYQTAFVSYDLGLGAAISMVLFLFLLITVSVYVKMVLEW